jgi:hypothetical protein
LIITLPWCSESYSEHYVGILAQEPETVREDGSAIIYGRYLSHPLEVGREKVRVSRQGREALVGFERTFLP